MDLYDETDHPNITIDPDIMLGKPTITGTRITVELILDAIAGGATLDDLLEDYPRLTRAGIQAALAYAADRIRDESARRRERVAS
ncbi:MAG TPA: DUF433 domain-containing protein [Chloroflexota bacterium]|nr:DUF433 domain-containing protein [Chloroflexota bacterium]